MTHTNTGLIHHKIGDTFNGYLLIKSATKGVASNGQPFLTLILSDNTGTIDAKVWNASEKDAHAFVSGAVTKVSGTIKEFRGAKQFHIQNIRPAESSDGILPEDLLEKAPEPKDIIEQEIDDTIRDIENPVIRRVVRAAVERYHSEFYVYPAAATIHHAFVTGLAYHTVSMLRIAKAIAGIYPEVNKDILYAGVILHDIGKVHEFVSVTDTSRSLAGNLLGHIPIMSAEIREIAIHLGIDPDSEEILVLQHMVLSHHGKPEWGSARTPIIREAELLHHIDNIDAKMNTLGKALEKTEPGDYTERLFSLDNRSFYKPLC